MNSISPYIYHAVFFSHLSEVSCVLFYCFGPYEFALKLASTTTNNNDTNQLGLLYMKNDKASSTRDIRFLENGEWFIIAVLSFFK